MRDYMGGGVRVRQRCVGVLAGAMGACLWQPALAQVLLKNTATMVNQIPVPVRTRVQDACPAATQRGTFIDGSLRPGAGVLQPLSLAANPGSSSWSSHAMLGPVRLFDGAFTATDVDIALPAPGFSWVIGRSYSAMHDDLTDPPQYTSDGYQGFNWFQMSQPELVLYVDSVTPANSTLRLIYGADRFAEYKRTGASSNEYRGVNGATGVFQYASGSPDTWTLYDDRGYQTVFFGGNTSSNRGNWLLWKIIDPADNTAYVGDLTTASTAVTNGYNSDGTISTAYDSAGRRYCYSYSTIGGASRLVQVLVETDAGGGWAACGEETMAGKVEYAYYTSDGDSHGMAGDLKLVTVTTPLSDSGVNLVTKTYYRYYDDTWSNTDGRRGDRHSIKMMVGAEGVRAADWDAAGGGSATTLDDDYMSASDATLKPYADAYLEYTAADDTSVKSAFFNGECGCGGGGANGTYEFTYTSLTYSATSGYDNLNAQRTVVERPDGTYMTQYFDEAAQPLSMVVTSGDPSVSVTTRWTTQVDRDTNGVVQDIFSPANNDTYTHGASSGTFTREASDGMVTSSAMISGGDLDAFPDKGSVKTGTSGTTEYLKTTVYPGTVRKLDVNGTSVARPLPDAVRSFHTATSTASDSSKYYETSYTYSFWSGTSTNRLYIVPKQVTATSPAVDTGKNGSGSATSTKRYIRKDGTGAFSETAEGVFTYSQYTNGRLTKQIVDCQTNHGSDFAAGDDPNGDFGITESGSGERLITTYTYDAQGRPDTTTHPDGRVTKMYYTKLGDGRMVTVSFPKFVSGSPSTFYGPASYTVTNHAGQAEFSGTITLSGGTSTTALTGWFTESDADPITALDVGTLFRVSTTIYNKPGTRAEKRRAYHTVPGSGAGSVGTDYDETLFGYDTMGRQWRTKSAAGTISRTVLDEMGRSKERWTGTNDSSFSGGESSGTDNMVKTEAVEYDGNASNGNGHVTKRTLYIQDNTTGQRETTYVYDARGRLVVTLSPQAPYTVAKYDNLNRAVAMGQYSSSSGLDATDDPTSLATNRVGLSQSFHDERGQVWKTQSHKIDVSDGSDDDNLQTLNWYDAAGRLIKSRGTTLTKTEYDRLGRATNQFVLAKDDDAAYADADDVTGDTVLEERQTYFESTSGHALMSVSISRHPNDTSTTGALDTDTDLSLVDYSGNKIKGRAQISVTFYDALERPIETVAYGTYNGSNFDRDSFSAPVTRTDDALVMTRTYNDNGTLKEVTDPKGLVTRTEYDAAGRRTAEIRNYVNGTPSGDNGDDDVYTRYTYANGLQTEMWVDLDGDNTKDASDQVTTYTYGVTKGASAGDSKITSGHLLQKTTYPDSSSGTDVVTFAYNAQGQQIWTKDQAGNIIETEFDTGGRQTHRRVTTLISGFDGAVRRISTTYTTRGMTDLVTQYDNATVGSGSKVDEVQYGHDGWGNLTDFDQDVDSGIGASGRAAFGIDYTYTKNADADGAYVIRRTTMTLPGAETATITYEYGATNSINDQISRVANIDLGANAVASYAYLGGGQVVTTTLDQAGVYSGVFDSSGTTYPYMDRFGRITSSRWTRGADFYRVDLSYDRNSNITRAQDYVHTWTSGNHLFDVSYTNDNLNRLAQALEGHWNGSAITGKTRDEQWTLSQTGNWPNRKLDLDGDGNHSDTDEMDDTSTFNVVNELIKRDTDSAGNWEIPPYAEGNPPPSLYDAVGNMVDDGKNYDFEYDAFGRMRKVKNRSNSALVAEYTYNGLGYRIGWHYDVDGDGTVESTSDDPWYYFAYDERWRVAGVFRGTDTYCKERYVYHAAGVGGFGNSSYIDLVVLRDRDTTASWASSTTTATDERIYYCQNWRADVSVITKSNGQPVEWIKYSAYGVPTSYALADFDRDGDIDAADETAFYAAVGGSGTGNPDVDFDGDSGTDFDVSAFGESHAASSTGGRGVQSRPLTANRIGYAGYQWDPIVKVNHVRHRVYNPEMGRWTRRDPLGNPDGPNSHEYVLSMAVSAKDPDGLQAVAACVTGSRDVCNFGGCTVSGPTAAFPLSCHLGPLPPAPPVATLCAALRTFHGCTNVACPKGTSCLIVANRAVFDGPRSVSFAFTTGTGPIICSWTVTCTLNSYVCLQNVGVCVGAPPSQTPPTDIAVVGE
jgi:RHS repeat-associated protein